MRNVLILALFMVLGLTGCPSKKEIKITPGHANPEDLKPGPLNKELENALDQTLDKLSPSFIPATCPDEIESDLASDLEQNFECGALRVPEFHNKKTPKALSVAYLRVSKFSDQKKPLLIIEQGGPGSSSMVLAKHYLTAMPELLNDFDILAVEQRGTSWTRPIATCDAIIPYNLKILSAKENDSEVSAIYSQCLQDVSKHLNLDSIGSYQIASDLVLAAKTFGYSTFSFFGVSYGTVVGQYLLHFYPDALERTILDSPVVLGHDWIKDALTNLELIVNKNLETFIKGQTFWSRSKEQTASHLLNLAQSYNVNPVLAEFQYQDEKYNYLFSGAHFMRIAFNLLTTSFDADVLNYLILAGDSRYANPQESMSLLSTIGQFFMDAEDGLTDLMYQSIICREFDISDFDMSETTKDWNLITILLGPNAGEEMHKMNSRCSLDFEPHAEELVLKGPIQTHKSVLVVGGEVDHVTIPAYVSQVAKHMNQSHQAVFKGVGHGVWSSKPCINESLLSYLKDSQGRFVNSCKD